MLGPNPHIARAFLYAEMDPFFVGHRLAQLREQQNLTLEQQARALHVDVERLAFLALCPMPHDDVDAVLLAGKVGVSAARLAELLGIRETR